MSMGPLSLITRLTKIPQFIKAKMSITPRDFLSLWREKEY